MSLSQRFSRMVEWESYHGPRLLLFPRALMPRALTKSYSHTHVCYSTRVFGLCDPDVARCPLPAGAFVSPPLGAGRSPWPASSPVAPSFSAARRYAGACPEPSGRTLAGEEALRGPLWYCLHTLLSLGSGSASRPACLDLAFYRSLGWNRPLSMAILKHMAVTQIGLCFPF